MASSCNRPCWWSSTAVASLRSVSGVEMPAVYVKQFGAGRVFFAMGGHELEEMERPEMTRLVRQGMEWAAR